MIEAVLFDLDNTLLDRDSSVRRFVGMQHDRLAGALGHIPKALYVTRFLELEQHGYVWKDKVYRQLVEEFSITIVSPQELLADYVSGFRESCIPFPGLSKALKTLKQNGVRLGIITNGFGEFQMANIRALSIEPYFDGISVSEWAGMKKPDVRIFQQMSRRLGVEPARCVFVGDHPENDVAAAERAGMIGVLKRSPQFKDARAELTISGLAELPPLLARLQRMDDALHRLERKEGR